MREGKGPLSRELSILVPAFNEAEKIGPLIDSLFIIARQELDEFEIIVVDDGSNDGTAAAAARAAAHHPESVRVIIQPRNLGVGAAYKAALFAASRRNVTLVPGDNAFAEEGIRRLFRVVGYADLVITYRANPSARAPIRRVLSIICNRLLRLTVRCPLRDGHSLYVWPTAWAREVPVPADYCYHIVSLTTLMRKAATFAEIPVLLNPQPDKSSRVMRFSVVWRLGTTMLRLLLRSVIVPPGKPPQRVIIDSELRRPSEFSAVPASESSNAL